MMTWHVTDDVAVDYAALAIRLLHAYVSVDLNSKSSSSYKAIKTMESS